MRAAYTAAGGTGMLEWRTAGGVRFTLSGPADPAGLAGLDRRLRPVAADDPRLAGVPEH